LCAGLGAPELASDPKYVTNADRVKNRNELEPAIEAITTTKTTQEWLDTFEGKGLPYAAVNDVLDTLNHDHVRARGMVQKVQHDYCGELEMVNTPVKYSEATPGIRTPPPVLGQHTDEVLTEILGLGPEEVEKLKVEGAVR
jgi:succinate--hydroxymethylglutarate CoA-transferase